MAPPPEPWSPPENLWMYWGDAPNKRFGHSGDNIRHLVKLGRMAGGEYRDPHFLESFASQTFRDLSESCCTAMLVAPMKHNMPIWNSYSNVAQRLRNYIANGNHLIFTGGSLVSMEFINTYFWYNIEPTSGEAGYWDDTGYGNWSPGPFRKLVDKNLPWVFKMTPDTLYQDHTSVQSVLLASLPDGARVIYMSPKSSPVFQIRFCQRLSDKHGEAPIKTLPRDCYRYAAKGYPCSCGTITYIGYDWHMDQTSEAWDKVMLAAVEFQADSEVRVSLVFFSCPAAALFPWPAKSAEVCVGGYVVSLSRACWPAARNRCPCLPFRTTPAPAAALFSSVRRGLPFRGCCLWTLRPRCSTCRNRAHSRVVSLVLGGATGPVHRRRSGARGLYISTRLRSPTLAFAMPTAVP
mmetsp:Transcript_86026/g.229571  ORF Transcript_86026/g.229571 Transcript_86026/m.229571 type:complete len:406 (-) Transcript_86026:319-1536(-)